LARRGVRAAGFVSTDVISTGLVSTGVVSTGAGSGADAGSAVGSTTLGAAADVPARREVFFAGCAAATGCSAGGVVSSRRRMKRCCPDSRISTCSACARTKSMKLRKPSDFSLKDGSRRLICDFTVEALSHSSSSCLPRARPIARTSSRAAVAGVSSGVATSPVAGLPVVFAGAATGSRAGSSRRIAS
jgi:hypothetical protein